jgi:DNA-directed RNA polymerase
MDRLKVQDNKDLERDMSSNAIVNTNKSAYEMAKRRAKEAQKERDNLRDVTREVNEIKCEMHDIKKMLTQLLEK